MSQSEASSEPNGANEATESVEDDSVRGFWGMIGLQFQGAFSDNVFKMLLIMIVMHRFADSQRLNTVWQAVIGAIFAIPFIAFSGWSGALADRFSKRFMILVTKVWEIGVMSLGLVALYFYSSAYDPVTGAIPSNWQFGFLIFVLTLMATQSTFFSPNKYGIMPEILPLKKLGWGNGILEMTTFGAIIIGMVAANFLFIFFGVDNLAPISIGLVVLACIGFCSGWFIQKVPAANPTQSLEFNHFPQVWANIRIIVRDRALLVSVAGICFFWSLGAIFLTNAPVWSQYSLGIPIPEFSEEATRLDRILGGFRSPGFTPAYVALGIGIGSYIVGALSKHGIELGFVPLGGIGLVLFAIPLGLASPGVDDLGNPAIMSLWGLIPLVFSLTMAGVSAGFFSVPLNALLQKTAKDEERGGVIAAMNFLNFTGILCSMALYMILTGPFGFSPANIFVLCAGATLAATVLLVLSLPEIALGLISTVITRILFRTRVQGRGNIPAEGPALLVCNHVSLVDALLVQYISPRPVRFVVWEELFESPIVGRFLKVMDAIPISSDMRPRSLIASLMTASNALNRGEIVCIFAPGQLLTSKGVNLPFRRGFNRILTRAPAPVIPIYLTGIWGSIFSYDRKKFVWRFPRQLRYYVQAAVGEPLPPDVSMHELRLRVQELSAECAIEKKDLVPPLHHSFIKRARKDWDLFLVDDTIRKPHMNNGRVLTASILFGRRLRKHWGDDDVVGIYLPPMAGAVLANVAAALAGRTTVNFNYTTGRDVLEHCIRDSGVNAILTSKAFLKKLDQEPPPGAFYIEDLAPNYPFVPKKPATWLPAITYNLTEAIPALLLAKFAPIRLIEKICGAKKKVTADDLVTIVYSSGSTGVPKGIMLSHFNVASNIESFSGALALWTDDIFVGILPFFHSFGYTVTLWGSMVIGYGAVHHANPLEAKVVGDMVEEHSITILLSTPTFLQHYIRRVDPEKFRTIEFVMTGAEKLPTKVREEFEAKFGQPVFEGYGTSECSPTVSANVDEYRSRGHHQNCNKDGTVGRALPGIAVKILDPESGEERLGNESGMIMVRGANIMQGYLHQEEKTKSVMKNGWYETGDIGFIDDEGFIHITDRLARFSKIGGEMVPHQRIEDELHEIMGESERLFAVTSVPDERKGERLAVVHILEDESAIDGFREKLAEAGLPNIWIPRQDMYFKVNEIPILGTGKIDLAGIRVVAKERVAQLAEESSKEGAVVQTMGSGKDDPS